MKVVRLRMCNYRRHRDTCIEFPDGVTAIVGPNGSGKTTILEAIAFALYGTPAARTQKALLRHDQAPTADAVRVELDAELAGQAIQVVRELRGTGLVGVASLVVDGQTIVPAQAGSGEAVTDEIARRLGLDREAFFNTVFAQQKEIGRLAQKTKVERKRLILGMLGIDALDRAIQEAGTLRRAAEAKVEALQDRMPDLPAAVQHHAGCVEQQQASAASAQAAAAAWTAAKERLAAATQRLEQARQHDARRQEVAAQLDRALQDARHAALEVATHQQQVAAAQEAAAQTARYAPLAASLPGARAELEQAIAAGHARRRADELRQQVVRLEQEAVSLQVPAPNGLLEEARAGLVAATATVERQQMELTVAATKMQAAAERLQRIQGLQDGPCPLCDQPVAHAARLHEHLRQEQAAHADQHVSLRARLEEARRHLATRQAAWEQVQAAQRRHDQAEAARRRIEEVLARTREEQLAAEAACPPGVVDVESLRRRVEEAEKASLQHARAEALAGRLPALQQALQAAEHRQAEAVRSAEAAQLSLSGLPAPDPLVAKQHAEAAVAEREAERAVQAAHTQQQLAQNAAAVAAQRVDEARQAATALAAAQQARREWQALAGVRGQGLLDRFRSHLVARIGPAVAAEASRLLGRFTGGRYDEVVLDEDYEIYVSDNGVRFALERFSGGETDVVNLALRLAVSRLLIERSAGTEIRFLALDEVFGSLDADRRGLVLQALQELGTLYSQVLLVTHHDDLQDALDHTLVVGEAGAEAVVHMHNG